MNQPTRVTRFIGTPRIAAVLYVGIGLAVLGWAGGGVPWWLALAALCSVGTVRKASAEVKRYDAWAKEWNAMAGGFSHAVPPPRQRPRPAGKPKVQISPWVAIAALLWMSIPVVAPSVTPESGKALTVLWCFVSLYLLWKVLRVAYRAVFRPKARTAAAGQAVQKAQGPDVVAWVLPRASSSPSRADAMRRLPEYSARLIAAK
jgi:hypothetical protein